MCLDWYEHGGACFGVTDPARLRPMLSAPIRSSFQPSFLHRSPSLIRETIFSRDRVYRYSLWRYWNQGKGYANFICLNPSTADERKDDPTIRKCIGFAKRWGFEAVCITNLFAFRSTDPLAMKKYPEPVGPDNNNHIRKCARDAELVIAAWSKHGVFNHRDVEVWAMVSNERYLTDDGLQCLAVNQDGTPSHPLYLKYDLKPQPYSVPEPF